MAEPPNIQDASADGTQLASVLERVDSTGPLAWFATNPYGQVLVKTGRRIYRLGGELFAAGLALAILVLFFIYQILDRQHVDLSLIRPNIGMWFSQTFEGRSADVGAIDLQWLPTRDAIRFTARDVTVFDAQGDVLQSLPQMQATSSIRDLQARRARFETVDIIGGEVTWRQERDGKVTAGLGRPATVGAFGPVYTGQSDQTGESRLQWVEAFEQVRLRESTAYIINENNGLNARLDVDELLTWREEDVIRLSFQGTALNNEVSAGQFDVHIETDEEFQVFQLDLATNQLRPDAIAPTSGRTAGMSGIKLPVDTSLSANYDRETGLKSAYLDIQTGAGSVEIAGAARTVDSVTFRGQLDPGAQVMEVERFNLQSDVLTFNSQGVIRDIGRLYDGNVGTSPRFDLNLDQVRLDARPVFEAPVSISEAIIVGEIDVDARELSVEELSADMGDYRLRTDLLVQTDQTGLMRLALTGQTLSPMRAGDLLSLWPVKFADGARRWIERSILDGDLNRISFKVDLNDAFFEDPVLTPERLNLEFDVSDGLVRYIHTMTPLSDAVATGAINGNALTLELSEGRIGDVDIESGSVEIPRLMPKGGDILISAKTKAPTQTLLELINQPPFQYMDRYGVSPDGFGGTGAVTLSVKRPLLEYFDQNRIEYSVSGTFADASAPFQLGDYRLHSADLTIEGGKDGLFLKGPANIGPWRAEIDWAERYGQNGEPTRYGISGIIDRKTLDSFGVGGRGQFAGEIDVEIAAEGRGLQIDKGQLDMAFDGAELALGDLWLKPLDEAATFSAGLRLQDDIIALGPIEATAADLDLNGHVRLRSDFSLIEARADTIKIPDLIDGHIRVDRDQDQDRLSVTAGGSHLDISEFVDQALESRSAGGSFALIAQAEFDTLVLGETYALQDARFAYDHDGDELARLGLSGTRPDGDFTVDISPSQALYEEGAAFNRLQIDVPDVSQASAALLGVNATRGGQLSMTADLPGEANTGPLVGSVEVTDFSVENAPFLAQILSLASFTGLLDTLSGGGLGFDLLEFDFSLREGSLAFREARMHGPALGMTGEGDINLAERMVDANGALVPSYTANSMLGDIPVLGDLLTGGEGGGIFAVTYSVRGPYSGAQVAINPLSALTPGFLRNMFETEREALPEMAGDDADETEPVE